MKIKQKKQLNLPQLIEWARDNEIKDRIFLSEDSYCVGFDRHGFIYFNSISTMPLDQLFTVEVEEEITEDTVFEYLINVYRGNGKFMELDTNECINEYNMANRTEVHAYIDGEFKLIWRDGKMVD